ncbi:hypothetical protein [Bradyrhizobium liaoningense]|uniref:hypothetical protein n=1 Tax=Bradyrhizobium sp. SMVTL-02 TaxID=3395917 RepID=UPI00077E2AFC|nr:hypothetical protein A1D31_38700 [Bradyrhizobium liaoningense]
MLTATETARAKKRVKLFLLEYDDSVRVAYQWLDAQITTKKKLMPTSPLSEIIQVWSGRFVAAFDVEAAAEMHPTIRGTYPKFNISSRLTLPSVLRLTGIIGARTHDDLLTADYVIKTYCRIERP